MKQLIMKDMKLLGFLNLVLIALAIITGYAGIDISTSFGSSMVYAFATVVAVYLITVTIGAKESKTKSDPLIISMPVNKFDIVKARYLTMIIYIFTLLGTMYLSSNILKALVKYSQGEPLSLIGILIISSIIIVFLSFFIPFQYYNVKNAQMFIAIIYLFILLSPNILNRLDIDIQSIEFIQKIFIMDFSNLGFIMFGSSLILYVISSFISRMIYEAKEF